MMLVPVPSTQYGKDFRRIVQSTKFNQAAYLTVQSLLITGKPLPAKYSSHPLSGDYAGYQNTAKLREDYPGTAISPTIVS